MEKQEDILDELTCFEKRRPREIPQILEDYLIQIAKTGDTIFPWPKLKPLFMFKMETVITEFHGFCPTDDTIQCSNVERFRYNVMKEKLLEAIDNFTSSAPFTIQRLCELVTDPRKHYKHTDKFMRGLEKNVLVVSTVEPGCSHIYACDCARKKSENQTAVLNGVADGTLNGVESLNMLIENKLTDTETPTTSDMSTIDKTDKKDNVITNGNKTDERQKIEDEKMETEKSEKSEKPTTQEKIFNSDEVVSSSTTSSSEDKEAVADIRDYNICGTEDQMNPLEIDSSFSETDSSIDNNDEEEMQKHSSPRREDDENTDDLKCSHSYTEKPKKDVNEDEQPTTSDLHDVSLPLLTLESPDDDDEEDDNDNDNEDDIEEDNPPTNDDDEVPVSSHSLDNEAADIDDNTMDVLLSDNSDSSSTLNADSSDITSSSEVQQNDSDPMDED